MRHDEKYAGWTGKNDSEDRDFLFFIRRRYDGSPLQRSGLMHENGKRPACFSGGENMRCTILTRRKKKIKNFYKITTKNYWQFPGDMLSYNQTEGTRKQRRTSDAMNAGSQTPDAVKRTSLSSAELFYIQEIGGTVRWNELCRTYWNVCRNGFRTVCKQILPIIENCRKPGSIMK